jgi:hypothetical protein
LPSLLPSFFSSPLFSEEIAFAPGELTNLL